MDFEKAFDKVLLKNMGNITLLRNKWQLIARVIQNIYHDNFNCVIDQNIKSGTFRTIQGLGQNGVLSTLLFIMFMDNIIKRCNIKMKKKLSLSYNHYRMLRQVNNIDHGTDGKWDET